MKIIIGKIFATALLIAGLAGTAHASHDNGQGKSQDGNHLESVSTAPEPSTFWLFLTGALGLAAVNRYQKKGATKS